MFCLIALEVNDFDLLKNEVNRLVPYYDVDLLLLLLRVVVHYRRDIRDYFQRVEVHLFPVLHVYQRGKLFDHPRLANLVRVFLVQREVSQRPKG